MWPSAQESPVPSLPPTPTRWAPGGPSFTWHSHHAHSSTWPHCPLPGSCHPQPHPWKNYLQGNQSLMPKRLGTAALVGILFFLCLLILFCIVGMIKVGWVWRINDAASPKYDLISHSLLSCRAETTGLVSPMKRERTRCPDPREWMCWNSAPGLWLPSLLPALPKTRSAPPGRTQSQAIK